MYSRVSSTNNTDRDDIAYKILKAMLITNKINWLLFNVQLALLHQCCKFTNNKECIQIKARVALSSPPVFSGVRVTRSLVLCVIFCRSLFVLLAIVLSVLSDYPFGTFKLFFVWIWWRMFWLPLVKRRIMMNVIEKIIAKQRATKDHFKQNVAHWLSYTCKGHDILRKYARIYAAPWGRVVY